MLTFQNLQPIIDRPGYAIYQFPTGQYVQLAKWNNSLTVLDLIEKRKLTATQTQLPAAENVYVLYEGKTRYALHFQESQPIPITDRPYTIKEIAKHCDKQGILTAIVKIPVSKLAVADSRMIPGLLALQLTDTLLLTDVQYQILEAQNNILFIKVSGNAQNILDMLFED